MSAKKCSKFRRTAASALVFESPEVSVIRKAVPALNEGRQGAQTLLRTGCVVCSRRRDCPAPVV